MIEPAASAERALIGGTSTTVIQIEAQIGGPTWAQQAPRLGLKFYGWLFAAGFLTFIFHEAAHWVAGVALGYDMEARLNAVRATTSVLPFHKAAIDAAGPFATILQAVIAFAVVMRGRSSTAFAFVYAATFMRLLAAAISVINPNDEARLSLYFGLGKWALPLIVSMALIALVWKSSRYLRLDWKEHLLCYLVASASISIVVGVDRFLF